MAAIRLSPNEVRNKVISGEALLVCAYDNEKKFRKFRLEGAISFAEFKTKASNLPDDQEIFFYWAWPAEASAAGQAEIYMATGFTNAKVLKNGVAGWKKAGYPIL